MLSMNRTRVFFIYVVFFSVPFLSPASLQHSLRSSEAQRRHVCLSEAHRLTREVEERLMTRLEYQRPLQAKQDVLAEEEKATATSEKV